MIHTALRTNLGEGQLLSPESYLIQPEQYLWSSLGEGFQELNEVCSAGMVQVLQVVITVFREEGHNAMVDLMQISVRCIKRKIL